RPPPRRPGQPRPGTPSRVLGAGRGRNGRHPRDRRRPARPHLPHRARRPPGTSPRRARPACRARAREDLRGGLGLKTAVILMAYGSPSRPEDVGAYLADIRGGRPVSPEAVDELEERYRRIGGGSPLNEITERQRAALEEELGIPVYVGMKHWTPRIAEAAERALAGGAERVPGLVLAPHYEGMSIGGYQRQLEEALAGRAELTFIPSYHAY